MAFLVILPFVVEICVVDIFDLCTLSDGVLFLILYIDLKMSEFALSVDLLVPNQHFNNSDFIFKMVAYIYSKFRAPLSLLLSP